jgi:hypothetical protein
MATAGLNDCRNQVNILCQNQEIPVGGRLGHIWQNWKKNNQRQLGFTNSKRGLQVRIHRENSSYWQKENQCF